MHIPDSVLSPITCAAAGVAMTPVWSGAARHVRRTLGTRQMPLLALGAAFCFTVMMFNIPALGGTTAHPVAGTLLAVMLGPWAACLGISVALLIQALFFGDGGLVAYGANCFTMAFVLPFAGYGAYRLCAAVRRAKPANLPVCAAVGAFVGINAAAAAVAVLLGIQPALFHGPNGHALYFPFDLHVTLPAMLGTHLLVAGPAEAVVTALVVRYLQTAGIPLYKQARTASPDAPDRSGAESENARLRLAPSRAPLWIGLLALVALTPLGLLAKGEAWGEWDARRVAAETERRFGHGHGYTPSALEASETRGYHGLPGLEGYASGDGTNRFGYLGAGLLGAGAIAGLLFAGGRVIVRREPQVEADSRRGDRVPLSAGPLTGVRDLPDWLLAGPSGGTIAVAGGRRNPFVERTLSELARAGAATLRSDRWAETPGLLQSLDARCKVLTLVLLVLATGLTRQPVALIGIYALAVGLALASRLPLGMVLRRVWLSVPVFVAAIALPATLTAVTPGHELLVLWRSPHVAISQPGVLLAATLALRVGVAVTFALLLTWTTRWDDLLRAMHGLRAPRTFLSVLAMTYRYLSVTLQTAADAFTARRSRTVGAGSNADGRAFIGLSIGALFGKSLAMAEEVHAAMLSRGFRGEMRTLTRSRWRHRDTAWTVALAAVR
jgi:cobalt/nickel transport system permease protein